MSSSLPAMPTRTTVIICPGNGCSNIRRSNWYGQLHDELLLKTPTKINTIHCICDNFPDPIHARRDIWVPHIRAVVLAQQAAGQEADDPTSPPQIVLVGHSSGAQAALRYAERYPVHAVILVAATYSDLDDDHERASGYYPSEIVKTTKTTKNNNNNSDKEDTETILLNPYDFDSMQRNCQVWYQFHSDNDPFIPLHEAHKIRDGLGLMDADVNTTVLDADGDNNDVDEDEDPKKNKVFYLLPGRSHFFDFSTEILDSVLSVC